MLRDVVAAGGTCAALALFLVSQGALPASADDEPAGSAVRIELDGAGDPRWELTRIDLIVDGVPQPSSEPSSDPSADPSSEDPEEGAAPVWSGVIAPGPHTLAALLIFRPRDADLAAKVERTIRIEAQHDIPTRPLRPLVLLITPTRPTPAPAPDLILARYTLAPE
jgi:hypothetical protein